MHALRQACRKRAMCATNRGRHTPRALIRILTSNEQPLNFTHRSYRAIGGRGTTRDCWMASNLDRRPRCRMKNVFGRRAERGVSGISRFTQYDSRAYGEFAQMPHPVEAGVQQQVSVEARPSRALEP